MKIMLSSYILIMTFKVLIWDVVAKPPKFNLIMFSFDRLIISFSIGCLFFFTNYIKFGSKQNKVDCSVKEVSINPLTTILIMIDRIGLSLYLINVPVIMMSAFLRKQALDYDTSSIVSNS